MSLLLVEANLEKPISWLVEPVIGNQGAETTEYRYKKESDYLGNGLVEMVTLPSGEQVRYEYDIARRVIAQSKIGGERIELTLDSQGNTIAEEVFDAKGQLAKTQQRVFDDLSRLLQSINADGSTTEYQYDQAGKPITIIDGMNHTKALAYDGLNRLIRSSDTDGDIVKTYDTANRVTSITDQRGLTTQYRYNGFGEKIEQISPDTGSSYFKYDIAGRMIEKVDARGETTQYRHDLIGRVTDVIYPSANDENIHYVYDARQTHQANDATNDEQYLIGRIAEVHQSTGTSYYEYNHRGQVAKHHYSIGAQQYAVEYHYAKGGKLEQMTYPSGRVVNYGHNKQGRLAEVSTMQGSSAEQLIANRFEAMPFGTYASFAYGNGSEVSVARDLNFRIKDICSHPLYGRTFAQINYPRILVF